MSVKQDRTYARTAQDIERKYQFGKTFAEMLGLINDNRDKVDEVESSLRNEITESSTTLKRDTQQIVMEATETVRTELSDSIAGVDESISELSGKVEMKLDADAVTIEVQKEIAKGVDRVVTKTGYEFGDDGLNISKSGEEMANLLDHTGMYVKRGDEEILTANNKGVATENLHTRTYLIIGKDGGRSRFEDYGIDRTACFWIGG
jgi:predicted hydrocarbon binding protein